MNNVVELFHWLFNHNETKQRHYILPLRAFVLVFRSVSEATRKPQNSLSPFAATRSLARLYLNIRVCYATPMPGQEHTRQIDMFTGERVDTRTEAQKRRDREWEKPQQVAMFSTQQVIEQARSRLVSAPMINQRGGRLELSLMIQDPRTEEEIEADRMKAAERQTVPLFGAQEEAGEPAPRMSFPSGLSFTLVEMETEEGNVAVRLEGGVELLLYTTREETFERARDSHDRLLSYRTWERGSDQLEIWLPDESGYYLITYCPSKGMIDDIVWVAASSRHHRVPLPELLPKPVAIPATEKPVTPLAIPQMRVWLKVLARLEQAARQTTKSTAQEHLPPNEDNPTGLAIRAALSVMLAVANLDELARETGNEQRLREIRASKLSTKQPAMIPDSAAEPRAPEQAQQSLGRGIGYTNVLLDGVVLRLPL